MESFSFPFQASDSLIGRQSFLGIFYSEFTGKNHEMNLRIKVLPVIYKHKLKLLLHFFVTLTSLTFSLWPYKKLVRWQETKEEESRPHRKPFFVLPSTHGGARG